MHSGLTSSLFIVVFSKITVGFPKPPPLTPTTDSRPLNIDELTAIIAGRPNAQNDY